MAEKKKKASCTQWLVTFPWNVPFYNPKERVAPFLSYIVLTEIPKAGIYDTFLNLGKKEQWMRTTWLKPFLEAELRMNDKSQTTICAPLKNSLELLTNIDHHCRASQGTSGPFLQFSGELLGKLDSRRPRASDALSPSQGSVVSIFSVAKTQLWLLVDRLKGRIWVFEAILVFSKWFCHGWEAGQGDWRSI